MPVHPYFEYFQYSFLRRLKVYETHITSSLNVISSLSRKGEMVEVGLVTHMSVSAARSCKAICLYAIFTPRKQTKTTAIRTWRAQTYIRSGSIMPLPWPFWGQQIYLAWIVDVSDNWLFPWIRSHWLACSRCGHRRHGRSLKPAMAWILCTTGSPIDAFMWLAKNIHMWALNGWKGRRQSDWLQIFPYYKTKQLHLPMEWKWLKIFRVVLYINPKMLLWIFLCAFMNL